MTGAVALAVEPNGNAALLQQLLHLRPRRQLLDIYDKFHLVPFGEYLPLAGAAERGWALSKLVEQPGQLSARRRPAHLSRSRRAAGGAADLLRGDFSGRRGRRTRPGWLVNVTDDSWFGPPGRPGRPASSDGAGPGDRGGAADRARREYRHLRDHRSIGPDRLRGCESGRMGVVDGGLPAALKPTFYVRFGDLLFLVLLFSCAAIAYIGARHAGLSSRE